MYKHMRVCARMHACLYLVNMCQGCVNKTKVIMGNCVLGVDLLSSFVIVFLIYQYIMAVCS